jgi:iron complex outermembrane recepter protein
MREFYKKTLAVAIPLGAGLVSTSPLLHAAESTSQMNESFALEEIVVTAQRREQSLQDVPISISAVDADSLKQSGATGLHDLGNMVAGVKVGNSQSSQQRSSIRGISSAAFGIGVEESVPFYLDGIYLGAGFSMLGELMDIEQIEVLKGPQGTLFGRNASAGAINVRTARPNDELTGAVSVDLGNYDLRTSKISGNIPVIEDTLLVRTGYSQTKRDGWQTNVTSGDKDGYEMDRWSGYVKALWIPRDDVEVEFKSDWSRQQDHSGYNAIAGVAPGTFQEAYAQANAASFVSTSSKDYAAGSNPFLATIPVAGTVPIGAAKEVDPSTERKIRGTSVKVTWDVSDEATFMSASSWRKVAVGMQVDGDGSDLGLISTSSDTSIEEMNQEFRLTVSNDMADWFVGFNAYRQRYDRALTINASGLVPLDRLSTVTTASVCGGPPILGCLPALDSALTAVAANGISEITAGVNTTSSYGLYGDAIFHLSDQLNLTVGVRYSYDEKEYEQAATANNSFAGGGILFPNIAQLENAADAKVDDSWTNISGRIGLDYALGEDTLIYTTLAQGYKSGGFNSTRTLEEQSLGNFVMPTSAAEPFDEETNINFEVGMKSTQMDGRLRLNASAFIYEYKDLQFLMSDTDSPVARTVNASKVDGYGMDTEIMFAATENLNLFANLSYIQAEYGDDVIDAAGSVRILGGAETPFAPEFSGTVGFDFRAELEGLGELRTNFSYSYTGAHQQRANQVDDNFSNAINHQEAYHVVNGRISLLSADETWELALWGKNLTDEYYASYTSASAASTAGVVTKTPAEPRTYGVNLVYNF